MLLCRLLPSNRSGRIIRVAGCGLYTPCNPHTKPKLDLWNCQSKACNRSHKAPAAHIRSTAPSEGSVSKNLPHAISQPTLLHFCPASLRRTQYKEYTETGANIHESGAP